MITCDRCGKEIDQTTADWADISARNSQCAVCCLSHGVRPGQGNAMTEKDYKDARALDFDFIAGAEFMLSRFVGTGFGSGRMLENGMLELHTGGWSECEILIDSAMWSLWWHRWWYQSMRGGHYLFGDPQ